MNNKVKRRILTLLFSYYILRKGYKMKKIITFDKELEFKTMIGEITSIFLEQDLKFIDQSNIEGNFYVTGTYKLTEASQIEEKFSFELPVEISLPETIDLKTSKIQIDDFNYEVQNDDTMVCHINVLIQGVEDIIQTEVIDCETTENVERECDGDIKTEINKNDDDIKDVEPITEEQDIKDTIKDDEKMTEEKSIVVQKETKETTIEQSTTNVGLFSNLKDDDETFSTYSVYIIRGNETLEEIIEKYKVKKEDLENYNDLSNIQKGTKLIIPTSNE